MKKPLNTALFYICFTQCVFYLTGCVTLSEANLQRTSQNEIPAYTVKLPEKEYLEIRYLQADGSIFHRPEKLLKRLLEKAKAEGADAVINVKYDYIMWLPFVSGTAIKYK